MKQVNAAWQAGNIDDDQCIHSLQKIQDIRATVTTETLLETHPKERPAPVEESPARSRLQCPSAWRLRVPYYWETKVEFPQNAVYHEAEVEQLSQMAVSRIPEQSIPEIRQAIGQMKANRRSEVSTESKAKRISAQQAMDQKKSDRWS